MVDVELASTSDEPEFYKFEMQAGELLTVNALQSWSGRRLSH